MLENKKQALLSKCRSNQADRIWVRAFCITAFSYLILKHAQRCCLSVFWWRRNSNCQAVTDRFCPNYLVLCGQNYSRLPLPRTNRFCIFKWCQKQANPLIRRHKYGRERLVEETMGSFSPRVTVISVIVAVSIHRRSSNHHTFLLFLLFFSATRLLLPFRSHVLMCTSQEADLPPAVPSRCALSCHIPFLFLPRDARLVRMVGANERVWNVSSNLSGWTCWTPNPVPSTSQKFETTWSCPGCQFFRVSWTSKTPAEATGLGFFYCQFMFKFRGGKSFLEIKKNYSHVSALKG